MKIASFPFSSFSAFFSWVYCTIFFFSIHSSSLKSAPSSESKTVIYSVQDSRIPASFDTLSAGNAYHTMLASAIYDTLYEYKYLKSPYELKPALAASMPMVSKDLLTYTIPIKKGVYFTDDPAFPGGKGREVMAEDFIFSIKRHFDLKNNSTARWPWLNLIVGLDEWSTQGGPYSQVIPGLQAIDKYTIQLKLKRPYPNLIYTLAMTFSAVVAKEVINHYGAQINLHPVGSGPWRMEEFTDTHITLVKNTKFREEVFDPIFEGYDDAIHQFTGIKDLSGKRLPMLDRIQVVYNLKGLERWDALLKGQIHYSLVPATLWSELTVKGKTIQFKKTWDDTLHLHRLLMSNISYFQFNMADSEIGHSKDPVRDTRNKALRCAIRKAFNWDEYVDVKLKGFGKPFPGMIPPQLEGYDPNLSRQSITYDPKGAKALLQEYGWNAKNLPILPIQGVKSLSLTHQLQLFRKWLAHIGYPKEKVVPGEYSNFGEFHNAIQKKQFRFTTDFLWVLDFPDAENILQLFYGSNQSQGGNLSNYHNPLFDDLFRQITAMEHSPQRSKMIHRANEILIDDCVVISGMSEQLVHAWDRSLILYPSGGVISNIFKYLAYVPSKKSS